MRESPILATILTGLLCWIAPQAASAAGLRFEAAQWPAVEGTFAQMALSSDRGRSPDASRWQLSLAAEGLLGQARPISATPFDPTSLPQDRFFGRESFSARNVALDLVINAVALRHNDSLVYRPKLGSDANVSTRWRIRLSAQRVLLRYEIRF